MSRPHHAIAVVGAGPRGTSVLERICASVGELAPDVPLTVHVVDPAPPGAGRVWRTAQSRELLMNTVASQVTLYTDDTVECAGPIRPGPSLHTWASSPACDALGPELAAEGRALGPDDYPTRAFYGAYLEWVFRHLLTTAPADLRVTVHAARAVRLADGPAGSQTLTLDDGHEVGGLSAVVLAQGHLDVTPPPSEARLSAYAAGHGLRHLTPANAADVDLRPIAPGESVLLRGLGLGFFDHLALLTTGRGGRFRTGPDGALAYVPSGLEPRLHAGSRRGVPHHARGDNAKGAHGRHEPLLFTPRVVRRFHERAGAGDVPDFLAEVWPLVAKEVETVYYTALLGGPHGFRDRFLAAPHGGAQESDLLDAFGVPAERRWCWDTVCRPHRGRSFEGPDDFRRWLLAYLRADVAHARLGNVEGPVKAALDVLRDLRNELRQIVDHAGLSGISRREHLDRWYTPLNAFLSIGPPRQRIEEMVALVEAGVLRVLGPRLEVLPGAADGGRGFTAHSPDVPGSRVTVTTLVEARLSEPDLRRTTDPLLRGLLAAGECRTHVVDGYDTGGLDVTRSPYRLLDREGRAHPRRFAFGVPTEGVHWVTAAGARPGVNSVTLADADAVARAALETLTPDARIPADARIAAGAGVPAGAGTPTLLGTPADGGPPAGERASVGRATESGVAHGRADAPQPGAAERIPARRQDHGQSLELAGTD